MQQRLTESPLMGILKSSRLNDPSRKRLGYEKDRLEHHYEENQLAALAWLYP
jgi:hypothetical protein